MSRDHETYAEVEPFAAKELRQVRSLIDGAEELILTRLEQLSEHVREHERIVGDVGDLRRQASQQARNVERSLQAWSDRVSSLNRALPDLSRKAPAILDRMQAMATLVQKVDLLAHSTLLNAINASAAAERAGAEGAAFGVVADEVASLPNRVTELSSSVQETIAQVQKQLKEVEQHLYQTASTGAATLDETAAAALELGDEIRRRGEAAYAELAHSTRVRSQTLHAIHEAREALQKFGGGRDLLGQAEAAFAQVDLSMTGQPADAEE